MELKKKNNNNSLAESQIVSYECAKYRHCGAVCLMKYFICLLEKFKSLENLDKIYINITVLYHLFLLVLK